MKPGPGLQAERTLLAWRRTSLSVVAGGALLLHLTVERFGVVGVVAGAVALCGSVVAHLASRRRYRALHRGADGEERMPDAAAVGALVSLSVIGLAVIVVVLWVGRAAEVSGR